MLMLWVQGAMAQAPVGAPARAWKYRLGGYYRSLFTLSRSVFAGTRYADSLNRLRLSVDGAYGDVFSCHFDFDNEVHFGNLTGLPDFDFVRYRQAGSYLDLTVNPINEKHVYWDASVYRGQITLRHGGVAMTAGRQRIAWGTARFFSPADVFNPLNPLQVEWDERQGVDAAQLNWYFTGESSLTAVYVPGNGFDRSTSAFRLKSTLHNYDVGAFTGRFGENWMGGADFAGQWKGAGLRGEFTYRSRHDLPGSGIFRMSLGADYAFANTLYFIGEYFYNQGQPETLSISSASGLASLLTGGNELVTLHRHFLSGGATYDITPLIHIQAYSVVDIAGESVFLNPLVTWDVGANTDLTAGSQFFVSSPKGEFSGLRNLIYAELTWHF